MPRLAGTIILTAGLGAACASHQQPRVAITTPASVQRAEQLAELAAIRAVLRAVQAQWKPEPGWERPTFYLRWRPPDDTPRWVLAKLKGEPYSVRKESRRQREACQRDRDPCPCGDLVYVEASRSISSTQFEAAVALGYPGWLEKWRVLLARDGTGWRSEEVQRVSVPVEDSAYIAAIKAVLRDGVGEPEPGQERSISYLLWRGIDPPASVLAEFAAEPYTLREASRRSRDICWCEETIPQRASIGPWPVRRKRCPCSGLVEVGSVTSISPTQVEASVMLGDPGWRSYMRVLLARDGAGWRTEKVWLKGME